MESGGQVKLGHAAEAGRGGLFAYLEDHGWPACLLGKTSRRQANNASGEIGAGRPA
jgi:hypothetical protein